MKSTAEILREARALIDTPDKWTKGAEALNADGVDVQGDTDGACRWCAGGALVHVAPHAAEYVAASHVLARAMGVTVPFRFNDLPTTSHADVLAAFDRAITLAETQA